MTSESNHFIIYRRQENNRPNLRWLPIHLITRRRKERERKKKEKVRKKQVTPDAHSIFHVRGSLGAGSWCYFVVVVVCGSARWCHSVWEKKVSGFGDAASLLYNPYEPISQWMDDVVVLVSPPPFLSLRSYFYIIFLFIRPAGRIIFFCLFLLIPLECVGVGHL